MEADEEAVAAGAVLDEAPNENAGPDAGADVALGPKPKLEFPVAATSGPFLEPKVNAGVVVGAAAGAGTGAVVDDPPNVNVGAATCFELSPSSAERVFLFCSEGASSFLDGMEPNAMLGADASVAERLDPN